MRAEVGGRGEWWAGCHRQKQAWCAERGLLFLEDEADYEMSGFGKVGVAPFRSHRLTLLDR